MSKSIGLVSVPSSLIIKRCGPTFSDLRPHDLLDFAFGKPAPLSLPSAKTRGSAREMRAAVTGGRRRPRGNGAGLQTPAIRDLACVYAAGCWPSPRIRQTITRRQAGERFDPVNDHRAHAITSDWARDGHASPTHYEGRWPLALIA
jgi:hypothetical protein